MKRRERSLLAQVEFKENTLRAIETEIDETEQAVEDKTEALTTQLQEVNELANDVANKALFQGDEDAREEAAVIQQNLVLYEAIANDPQQVMDTANDENEDGRIDLREVSLVADEIRHKFVEGAMNGRMPTARDN